MEEQHNKFDPDATLSTIRAMRAAQRHRRTWGRSCLVKHRAELVKLREAGASYADLALWLKKEKRITIDRSTIMRYLQKLPETNDG